MSPGLQTDRPPWSGARGEVRALPCLRSDEDLLAGLRGGERWAQGAFFDRFAPSVARILRRLMGGDRGVELEDLVHDTFVQALASVHRVRDGVALAAWMEVVASRTAYRAVRARKARRWLRFWEPADLDGVEAVGVDPDLRETYVRTLRALDALPAAERIPFMLQHVEGWQLPRIAEACGVSIATVKRRIAKGAARFGRAAQEDGVLQAWIHGERRWSR